MCLYTNIAHVIDKNFIFRVERHFKLQNGLRFRDFCIKFRGYMMFFEKKFIFKKLRFLTIRGDQAKKSKKKFFLIF